MRATRFVSKRNMQPGSGNCDPRLRQGFGREPIVRRDRLRRLKLHDGVSCPNMFRWSPAASGMAFAEFIKLGRP